MSLDYYDKNADQFIDRTVDLDFSPLTEPFLDLVGDKGRLLDLGCGSGRDAKYFLAKGYDVYAVDGSKAMVDHVKEFLGDRIFLSTFEDFKTDMTFDGIWASASLLHVAPENMIEIISKFRNMLTTNGIFFMSFKNREAHFEKDGRHFTCYDEKRLIEMLFQVDGLKVVSVFETEDFRVGKDGELWVNCFCERVD